MDKYVLEQLEQIHELCHQILGYLDAKADLKENLRFATDNDEPKILLFPNAKNSKDKEHKQRTYI